MVACDKADQRNDQEERNETRRREFIVTRPREGYREFGDVLEPDTQRMGRNTFAIRRQPGERIGSVRS